MSQLPVTDYQESIPVSTFFCATEPSNKVMGSLHSEPVVTALGRFTRERRSGDLQVYSGLAVKCVYLDRGVIVFASSNLPEDRLGDRLVEQGRITLQQMNQARDQAEKQGQRFGAALVQSGHLSQHEILYEVSLQLEHIIFSLFKLTEGVYFFDERECAIPENLRVPRPAPAILVRGARLIGDLGVVMGALPPLSTLVRLAENEPPRDELHELELAVLEAAGGEVSLQTIMSRVQGSSTGVARACLGLLAAGHLERAHAEPPASSLPPLEQVEELPSSRRETTDGTSTSLAEAFAEGGGSQRHASEVGGRERESSDTLADFEPAPQEEARVDSEPPRQSLQNDAESPDPVRQSAVEDLARDARLHVETKDWAGAIKLLCNLIEHEPAVASYHVMLAKAMSHFPSMQRSAERHFSEAMRLDPNDPNVRHALGCYYRRNGRLTRAAAEFREALRLDPQHPTARREIEQIERQESKGSLLRRFLGS